MKYKINALIDYDPADGSLTLNDGQPEIRLTITANSLLYFFIQHPGIITRDEVLKKVWDDNGLVSSNSNLNQYLSLLRKTFRHYGIDNIIVTIPKGKLELNPDVKFELINETTLLSNTNESTVYPESNQPILHQDLVQVAENSADIPSDIEHISDISNTLKSSVKPDICWYLASAVFLACTALLTLLVVFSQPEIKPIPLLSLIEKNCELSSTEEMINSVVKENYTNNFNAVKDNLAIKCGTDERFIFFYGDKLQTNGLGRVFLAHCAKHEDNPFSYCDNYFYYSWKYQ